ncbi:class I SAM-dependent methyltransferase, partial [Pseudoalteromonas sp. S1608]|uniref:class I SAM-dependent methyltransferase n=1 Tax=Pseudoalteromonas sp. S1608 TaxID=579504 RepID=UPI001288E599
ADPPNADIPNTAPPTPEVTFFIQSTLYKRVFFCLNFLFPHAILKSFGKLKQAAPFDLISVDPPCFQKGGFILTKDYPKVLRSLRDLLNDTRQLL